ncbi:MAG: response regulator [Candidatus Omnitrophica bacterium]|nr:response regulator [Candidatus Omnitrophota bacterium]
MSKCVLIVDDEPIVVEIAKRKLEDLHYQVMTAQDGEEALEALKKKIPDLILLDIQMPKMNGYTFLMEKAKVPEYDSIPVVVLTAYGEMEPLFKRHGVKAYLLKPLKLQELLEKVQSVLGV